MTDESERTVDREIATRLFGWSDFRVDHIQGVGHYGWDLLSGNVPDGSGKRQPVPFYESDLDDAWLVVSRMAELGYSMTLYSPNAFTEKGTKGSGPDHWTAWFISPLPKGDEYEGQEDLLRSGRARRASASEAICSAAIQALNQIKVHGEVRNQCSEVSPS